MCNSIDYNNKNPSDPVSPYFSYMGGELKGPVTNRTDMNKLFLMKVINKEAFGLVPPNKNPTQPPPSAPPAPLAQQTTQATQTRQSVAEPVTRSKQPSTMRRRTDLRVPEQVNLPRSSLSVMGGGGNSGVNVPT